MWWILIVLLCLCAGYLYASGGKKTICLNMIVKNEKPVITRCLASVKPLIDHWVIVDTGSTDGTQEAIREFMKDIPGELYERPWRNFEHNRNEALDYARGKGDYILIMDADDILEFEPTFKLPRMDAGSYRLWIKYKGTSYQRHHFLNARLPWKWVGLLHEALECTVRFSSDIMDGVKIIAHTDGARSRNPRKFEQDAAVLEEALKNDPENTRYMFYLAQSYKDAGMLEKAIEWYLKRIAEGGWNEEVYLSMVHVGLMERELKRPDDVVTDRFFTACRTCPHRTEAVVHFSSMCRKQGQFDRAYSTIKLWQIMPKPVASDVLFLHDWTVQYGLLFELAMNAFHVGQYQESLNACTQLLAMKELPEELRNLTIETKKSLDNVTIAR